MQTGRATREKRALKAKATSRRQHDDARAAPVLDRRGVAAGHCYRAAAGEKNDFRYFVD